MKRHSDVCGAFLAAGALVLLLFQAGCSTVAVTGRNQLDLIPASTMLSMSDQQYSEFLSNNRLSTNREQTALVKKVGTRIQASVDSYFRSQNMSDQLEGYSWQFNLIDNKEANAWCMPGGRVVVYSGILPITRTEAGLAVVLAHEIAHAAAEHGSERMSQDNTGQAPPEFMSTHPSDETRIANIEQEMPEAMRYYRSVK